MLFNLFSSPVPKSNTAFSKFIREASSEDKKRVYSDVIAKATKRQATLIEKAKREEHGYAKG